MTAPASVPLSPSLRRSAGGRSQKTAGSIRYERVTSAPHQVRFGNTCCGAGVGGLLGPTVLLTESR
jgi:hypothetical protein